MKWTKIGKIFTVNHQYEWMFTHASVPFAEHIEDDIYRVYFSTRDNLNRSSVGYFDIDLGDPFNILNISEKPILSPGELGAFDDSGTMLSWITNVNKTRYMYYIGWNLGVTVPFRNSIGLAISEGNGEFKRFSQGPILDRTYREPHFCASSCVIKQESWKMWYLSCTGWKKVNNIIRHYYHIKYAESNDGINWRRDGHVCIDFESQNEYAISRPSVIYEDNLFKMWYSYRGEKYRIGYAESLDGINWKREDNQVGIDISSSGWDSDMIEYPHVFNHNGKKYMLYNGNDYGKTGIGLAILD